jgi:large subunit ribosomal protein L9
MKVILKQDIKGVGKKDQIINAADGYARNFLFPKGLAVPADSGNMNDLKAKNNAKEAQRARDLASSKKLAEDIKDKTVVISVKSGNNGKLFGGVTSKEISTALKEQLKVDIDKKKIVTEVIKQEGIYTVDLKLQEGVVAKVKVHVQAKA